VIERLIRTAFERKNETVGRSVPLAVGVLPNGRIWVTSCRPDEGRFTGETFEDALRAWLEAHPTQESGREVR